MLIVSSVIILSGWYKHRQPVLSGQQCCDIVLLANDSLCTWPLCSLSVACC